MMQVLYLKQLMSVLQLLAHSLLKLAGFYEVERVM